MPYDAKSKSRSALLTRSSFVNDVKPLEDAVQVFFLDTNPIVCNRTGYPLPVLGNLSFYANKAKVSSVFESIVYQITDGHDGKPIPGGSRARD